MLTVGPLASRDFVIPIDLASYSEDFIEVKLETGFMFWEVDYTAMDFTNYTDVEAHIISPSLAFGTHSKNWTEALTTSDRNYMAQENVGDVTEVIYKAHNHKESEKQSIFLEKGISIHKEHEFSTKDIEQLKMVITEKLDDLK